MKYSEFDRTGISASRICLGTMTFGEQKSAAEAYLAAAQDHGLDPARMALGYVCSGRFLASPIIGARTAGQLENNLEAVNVVLDRPLIDAIETIHESSPDPAP